MKIQGFSEVHAHRSCFRLALDYAFSDRVQGYKRILDEALSKGYRVCSVIQSLCELEKGCDRLLVLRHDVDAISPGAMSMAWAEKQVGVQATYYFRWATYEQMIIESLLNFGHEVSYHYETIADYSLSHNIQTQDSLKSMNYLEDCCNLLENNLRLFREKTGAPCLTLAAHGAAQNKLLGVSNAFLFEAMPALKERLRIRLETYDHVYLSQFDCYISDSQWEINNGFRYGVHPLEAIRNNIPRIMLLTHPNHWDFILKTRLRRIVKAFLKGQIEDSTPFAYAKYLRQNK